MTHSLKIFEGLKISFLGISDDEVVQMTEINLFYLQLKTLNSSSSFLENS